MKSVFEIAYRYIEPSIKRSIAIKLYEKGIPKIKIAEILSVSPSLITRYIKGEKGTGFNPLEDPRVNELIYNIVDKILSNGLSGYEVEREIHLAIAALLAEKRFCRIHKNVEPSINPPKCNICIELFTSRYRLFPTR
ncbi:transcriptional regulator [Desulfurococcus amylolyticus]|uniref:Transcriptional regulator n=1 Tax=Desulfurococcus amylolyticus DSM 16532 TaxID=768672 RepID=I3XQL2_DESAM|nr:hypothetical protein [Desulfurococcus amylolyticus]AFL66236.1 hypothetical protein Desfe_0326 [Desulfurococcus amylolyticus DSM 16532]